MHIVALLVALYLPGGHGVPVGDEDPAAHAQPGPDWQGRAHAVALVAPTSTAAVPDAQYAHVRLPPPPYLPAGHGTPVALVEPRGQ